MSVQWRSHRIRPIALLLAILALAATAAAQDAPRIGLKIRTLTAELRNQHGLPADLKGVLVIGVEPGSPAAQTGIAAGEVVVNANGKSVATAKAVAAQIQAARTSGSITFTLVSVGGERKEMTVTIPKSAGALLPGPK
jgi:serine protease Do